MTLSEPQELVGNFGEMIVQIRDPAIIWPLMFKRLQDAIGFDAGYIGATWGDAVEGRGAVAEHDAAFLRSNLGRFLAEISSDEVVLYMHRARVHEDVWSAGRRRQLSAFRELHEPSGMKHMIVRVSVSRGNLAGLNLERRDALPYSDRDLHFVDLVAPFLHIAEVLTLCSQEDCIAAAFAQEYHLTKRENELISLIARGLQNSEIALLLGISSYTVRNTLARVFEKVGVTNRAELTYLATRPGARIEDQSGRSRPSGSRVPSDALREFRARVEKAAGANATARSEPPTKATSAGIVYTPPLSGIAGS